MKLLIVANGDVKEKDFYKNEIENVDYIIAADGGADKCLFLGIEPNEIIGDMDSLSDDAREKFSSCKFIKDLDQNKTDLQLAIERANFLMPENVIIIGAIGDNIDHTLANIFCLEKIKSKARIINENNEVYFVDSKIVLKGNKEDIVSVIALTDVEGLNYKGLRWEMKNEKVSSRWVGIRNRMIENCAEISLISGRIIVIKVREKK